MPMAGQLRRLSSVFKSNTKLVQPAKSKNSKEYLMVMGNEARDLDSSIASSITYAWLQSQTCSAIIQISKDDLALRPENTYALRLCHGFSLYTIVTSSWL
ncbi:hypothetical protein BDZ89DRAFT_1156412 [Hymenopellis radicata]|nr:hypothetical protein BDZ89DRAFT_1156412 [Hymenopellis radicata]